MAKLKSSKKDNTFKLTDIEIVNVKKTSQAVVMVNPETGEQIEAASVEEAEQLSQMGYMPADTSMENGGVVLKSPSGVSITKKDKDNRLSVAEKLTGEYIEQVPTHQLVDARDEVEEDEYLKFPNNEIREAHGERHEEGGINLNLEKGTKILSNNLTIGKDLAKKIESEYGIKAKPDMTYADILDKYSSKIGLEKLNEEQEELFAMISKQEKTKDDNTKKVNLEYLNAKVYNIEKKKNTLKIEQDTMFERLFAKQEEAKSPKPQENFSNGGIKGTTELQAIADKHGISLDRAMFLLGGMKDKYEEGGTDGDPMDAAKINYLKRVAYLEEQAKKTSSTQQTTDPTARPTYSKEEEEDIKLLSDAVSSLGSDFVDNYYDNRYGNPFKKEDMYNYYLWAKEFQDLKKEYEKAQQSNSGDTYNAELASKLRDEYYDNLEQYAVYLNTSAKHDWKSSTFLNEDGSPADYSKLEDEVSKMFTGIIEGTEKYIQTAAPNKQQVLGKSVNSVYENPKATDPNKQPNPVRGASSEPYSVEEAFTPKGIERLNVKLVNLGLQPLPTTATKEQVLAAASSMQQTGITKFPELVQDYALNTAKPTNKHGDILSQVNKEKGTKYANTNEDLKKALAAGDITPEQVRSGYGDDKWWYRGLTTTRQKVSPEEYARIQKEREKDFIQSGESKYLRSDENPDEYIEYYTDDTPPAATPEAEVDITNPRGYDNIDISPKPLLKTGANGYFFPDQSVLPPNPLEPHLMVTNRRQRIDPVKIGIEDNLTELNRQALTMESQLDTLPPSQRAAAMASLLTATQQGANTAITGANRTNAQNQQNAELFNIRQADAEDTMRGNNLRQFEALQLTAKAKTDKDLRDYFSYNRRVALNNLRSQQTLNMIEVQSPDYSLDLFGNAVNFDPSYTYRINQGSV